MYFKQTLNERLDEALRLLTQSDYESFGSQLLHIYQLLTEEEVLLGFLEEVTLQYPYTEEMIEAFFDEYGYQQQLPENKAEYIACRWQAFKLLSGRHGFNLHQFGYFGQGKSALVNIINRMIVPLFSFLKEKLKNESSINYVLKRYKRRIEWFQRSELLEKYQSAERNYEDIFDSDLRLYLFDQGLEHPISKPMSADGSADIIGNIDHPKDSFILEVKLVDKKGRNYGAQRVISGIVQAYKYAANYGKICSHVVIFNLDEQDIKFNSGSEPMFDLPVFHINEKIIFCVVINLNMDRTASKLKTLQAVEIKKEDVLKELAIH